MISSITGVFQAITKACNDTANLSASHLEDLGRRFFRSLEDQGLTGERTALTDLLHDRDPKNADRTLVEAASRIFTGLTSQAKQALRYSTDSTPFSQRERPEWAKPLESKPGSTSVTYQGIA